MELIKCQDVAVGLDLFFAFSNGDSSDVVISSAISKGNFLLLITPFNVFGLSCGYALHLAMWKIFILRRFSACLQLFT